MNTERRQFIRLLFLGGVTLAFGKLLRAFSDSVDLGPKETTQFRNFKIVESRQELGVYGSDGEEILVIDKESF